ncbi:hypothetical protein QWY31_03495 [Cytophagales bacterium LB-30]|uniref:Galactose oxidase n=1 Tax=Shiella aurantiaca TaxID=3058365 RepID=A0ABT8F2P5_9BACT|nr:hypothetical protein [Shiella aurantiaca]MDN4164549.1 hypothetical protein [Shiella aurantiaca]
MKYPFLNAVLLVSILAGCDLLNQEEDCPITAEPLTDEDYTLTQDVVYHNTVSGDVYYIAGECFGGSAELVWDYSGEVYEVNGRVHEVLSSGTMCVELHSGDGKTDPLCKDVTVHRKHVWATHYLDFPGGKTKQSVVMNINGTIYSGFGMFNNWYRFDTLTFRWTERTNIPNLLDFNAFAGFAINGKGYLVGNNSILYEYNPSADTWTNKGQLPTLVSSMLNLGAFGDRAQYDNPVLGISEGGKGYFGIGALEHLYEYNPATNQWTQLADRPERGKVGELFFAYQGKIYTGKYVYDIATDTWARGGENFSVDAGFALGFVPFKGVMYGCWENKTVQFDGEEVTEVDLEGATMFTNAPSGLFGNGAATGDIVVFPRLMGMLGQDEILWRYYIDK